MKIKGAIFDMDGTVIDSLMYWGDLWKRIGQTYMNDPDFKVDETVDKKVRTMITAEAMAYIKDYYNIPGQLDEFCRVASGGKNFYRDVAKAKPGAAALLAYLKGQNVKLCLASATNMSGVRFALECHDLLKYFDIILSCADLGVDKEQPDIYLKAEELMGIPREEICVFEDSYVALETAKKAGFRTIGVFDRFNFEQERLKAASNFYLGEHHTLDELIHVINT